MTISGLVKSVVSTRSLPAGNVRSEDAENPILNDAVTAVPGVSDPDGDIVIPSTLNADTDGMQKNRATTAAIITSFINPFIINLTRTRDQSLLQTYSIFSLLTL